MYAKFHHSIPLSSNDRAILTFSEFGARQNLDRWKMTYHNLLGWILIISMFTQKTIKIFHSVQELRPFSLFQNLALGKASTDDKCHFAIVSHFFRIWTLAKTQPISNVIWQSHGVHLVNTNVYAKFYQTIPNGLRVIGIFHEQARDKIFTNRPGTKSSQTVRRQKQMFDYRARYDIQEIAPLSLCSRIFELGKVSINKKCHFAISWSRSCQYQCVRKRLSNATLCQNIPLSLTDRAIFTFSEFGARHSLDRW